MLKYLLSGSFFFLLLLYCTAPWSYINTIPMYGNAEKPPEIREVDRQFIKAAIDTFGSADSAAYVYASLGWSYLFDGKMKTAIRRFNQSWLLDSSKADCYFGFAGYQEITGKNDFNKYYQMGRESSGYINRCLNTEKNNKQFIDTKKRILAAMDQK